MKNYENNILKRIFINSNSNLQSRETNLTSSLLALDSWLCTIQHELHSLIGWRLTWWFIIALRHMIQTWTSSLASPMLSLDILVWRGDPIVFDRFSFLAGLLTRPSKLVLFSLFSSCSFLLFNKHNLYIKLSKQRYHHSMYV